MLIQEFVALVVSHETAHQWFGNLVTMEWWTHLWLNEGFARFMENLTTDALYPEFHIWDQFVPSTMIEAFKLDALDSSHPIEVSFHRFPGNSVWLPITINATLIMKVGKVLTIYVPWIL